ncbi:MAG: AAA family ATPase [Caldisericia bacterium]
MNETKLSSFDFNVPEMLELWKNDVLTNQTFMIVGPTGIGKTQWVYKIADIISKEEETPVKVKVVHLARMSNTDFVVPVIDKETGNLRKAVTKDFVDLVKTEKINGKPVRTILFFDEFDRATPDVRNAILSLLNERVFEDLELPDSVSIILAGNQFYSKDTYSLNNAEKTRMSIYYIDLSNLTTESGYFKYWMSIAKSELHISDEIIAYLYQNPQDLAPNNTMEDGIIASPRSWELLSKSMDNIRNMSFSTRMAKYKSLLGDNIATKFATFIDYIIHLPSVEDILSGKAKLKNIGEKFASLIPLKTYSLKGVNEMEKVVRFIADNYGDELLVVFTIMNKNSQEFMKIYQEFLEKASNDSELYKKIIPLIKVLSYNFGD